MEELGQADNGETRQSIFGAGAVIKIMKLLRV
jgi:hypothetical protein